MASNLTITPSSTAAHPVIKNSETTSSVTYTITETTPTANGVTYNITGDDADKFVVTYAASSIDATQKATITLISAANILTQILYKINLVATSVDNPSDSKLLAIGIFVSSASSGAPSASLTASVGANLISSILELSTESIARYPLAHTNANDLTNMSVGFANNTGAGLTAALVRQDDGNGVDTNYITLVRTTTGADGGDAAQVTPDVLLTYTGANSGNTLPGTDPSYTVTMTLTVNYTPVKIKFFKELTLDNELDSGSTTSSATTSTAVATYYDGRNSVDNLSVTVIPDAKATATKHDIPVYLDQQCTWSLNALGTDFNDFKIYPDDGSGVIDTTALLGAAAKAKTAWIRLDRTAVTNYATKKSYTTTLTLTDAGGSIAVDNTQTRSLNITMAVSHDSVNPVINDISFNGTAYAGSITSNAVVFDVDEVAAATEVAKFKMDHTLHGANDLVTSVDYYLQQTTGDTTTAGSAISIDVDSVSGGSTATFSVTAAVLAETSVGAGDANKEATVKVTGITFKDNYTQVNDNKYVFDIFAKDAVDTIANNADVRLSSVPITVTVTVKNTTGMSYTGQSGTQSTVANTTDVVSNGVVTNSGTTNASTVEFAFFANIPASAAAPADGTTSLAADKTTMGILLTDAASVSQIALVSDVVVSTVTHPNAAMATGVAVKKFAFSVTGMTNAAVYTLTMPTLTPATSHQNVSGQTTVLGKASANGALPAANAMVDTKSTFVFTYSTTSQHIYFHGPDDVTWARGHPYTETFYNAAQVTSPTAVTAANSTINILGARYTAVAGNKMSYYNAVDPTAAAGTTGYFTWTVTNAAGGQSSRTRTVTIQEATDQGYTYTANLAPRSIPTLRSASTTPATATYNLTFAGSTGTATAPLPLNYKDDNAQQNLLGEDYFQSGIKADTSPDTNAAGTALAVAYTQELSVSNRGTLWAYLTPGSPGNATFDEIYRVTNEDIYAYNFGDNNTSVAAKTHTFDADSVSPFNVKGATIAQGIAGTATTHVSKTGTSQTGTLTLTLDTNPADLITAGIYTDVPTTGGSPGSTGATFDVTVAGGTITAIVANAPGTGYDSDDTLRIDHALIGVSAGNTNATVIRQLDTGTKTGWDTLRGKRTVTIIEAAGHIINIELGGLNIDQAIVTAFSLQATADWSSNITVFEDHATCKLKMSKNDFNSVFFYKPETPGMTTPGVGGWSNLLTSRSLRSENIEMLQVHTAWPTMKGGDATGLTAGTSHNLHQLNTSLFQDKDPFEAGVPDSSVAIKDVVVENWTYDLFGVKNMADIFSSTPAMKTEIENYLTDPSDCNPVRPQVNATAATTPPTSTLEGAIRLKLKDLSSAENVATRTTNWSGSTDGTTNTGSHLDDTTTIINSRPAQFLLYALHDKIQGTDAAHYRLTTNVGGMFHADNKVTAVGNTKDFFPFIWQAGDMITVGTQFAHDPVTGGSLFNDGGTKTLGNLPFKFVITLV